MGSTTDQVDHVLSHAFSLTKPCFNNVVESSALLISLQFAQQMGVTYLKAYDDSKLIVNQIKREYEVRHEDLIPYHYVDIQLTNTYDGFYISHVSYLQNTKADALAVLVTTLALPAYTVATRHLFCPKFSLEVHTISTHFEPRDWRFSIMDYALHDILLDDSKEAASIRRWSSHFYYDLEVKTLYHNARISDIRIVSDGGFISDIEGDIGDTRAYRASYWTLYIMKY